MGVDFERVIPILRIFSIDKAKEFYVQFLGFRVDWEHRFDEKATSVHAGLKGQSGVSFDRALW